MKTNELQEGQQVVITLDAATGPCSFTVLTVEESAGYYRALVRNDLYGAVWIDDNIGVIL